MGVARGLRQRACTELLRQGRAAGLFPTRLDAPAVEGVRSAMAASQAIETLPKRDIAAPEPFAGVNGGACRRYYVRTSGVSRAGSARNCATSCSP